MGKTIRQFGLLLWLPVAIVSMWWFSTLGSTDVYVPPLKTILETFRNDWFGERFITDALPSIGKFALGFLIASVGGIVLGTLFGLLPMLHRAVDPLIQFIRSVPPPALLPIALLLFGIGPTMNVSIIVLGAIWPVLLNTADGIRAVDPQVLDMAKSYRLPWHRRLFQVLLPAAAPQIFTGLRVTLQLSIILIVVAEMYASTNGIGFYVLNSQQMFAIPETWAGTILLGLLGYAATALFILLERRVLRWHRGLYQTQELS